jgi:hypothetical protein
VKLNKKIRKKIKAREKEQTSTVHTRNMKSCTTVHNT